MYTPSQFAPDQENEDADVGPVKSAMIGEKLAHYRITALLGSGGMGQVYRATDTTLGRDVAIKMLPQDLTQDPDRVTRFSQEARVLASLNHPHIAAVYGLEHVNGRAFLSMELVPGETLAERIARNKLNGLPVDEVLPIARQIAEALDGAHQKGVIHRDLMPANIKITPEGVVKVLDFGLAKVIPAVQTSSANSQSPTASDEVVTETGIIIGTAAYMSPEQTKGLAVDKRSDLWAFGCVIYEMLTGSRAFGAPDMAETLAAVLTREPDWSRLPPNSPRVLRRLLKQCLQRDRLKRTSDVAAALFALDDAVDEFQAPEAAGVSEVRASSRGCLAFAGWLAAIAVAIGAVWLIRPFSRAATESPTLRLQVESPPAGIFDFALSPNGQRLAFFSSGDMVIRDFGSGQDQVLKMPEGGSDPFWAPDGLAIAYFSRGKLKRIDLASGCREIARGRS